jgi:hypothetical protein
MVSPDENLLRKLTDFHRGRPERGAKVDHGSTTLPLDSGVATGFSMMEKESAMKPQP